jgi:hypothetical protein
MIQDKAISPARFDVEFVRPAKAQTGVHTPGFGGLYRSDGQVQIYLTHVQILQNAFGWTYYLGYLFGPLGFFLAPALGGLTSRAYIHDTKWGDIRSLRFDHTSGMIEICGVEGDGKVWFWTFKCAQAKLLLGQLSQFAKVDGFEVSPSEVVPSKIGEAVFPAASTAPSRAEGPAGKEPAPLVSHASPVDELVCLLEREVRGPASGNVITRIKEHLPTWSLDALIAKLAELLESNTAVRKMVVERYGYFKLARDLTTLKHPAALGLARRLLTETTTQCEKGLHSLKRWAQICGMICLAVVVGTFIFSARARADLGFALRPILVFSIAPLGVMVFLAVTLWPLFYRELKRTKRQLGAIADAEAELQHEQT